MDVLLHNLIVFVSIKHIQKEKKYMPVLGLFWCCKNDPFI